MYLAKFRALEPEKDDPCFTFITFADDYSAILRTTKFVGEKEIRATMCEMGMPGWMIDSHIADAPLLP